MPEPETVIERLRQALSERFEGEVSFADSVPSTLVAPSVVVSPGDPFLEPRSLGAVREKWDILVVVNFSDRKSALTQMRDISLRVREAVVYAGGVWEQASGPRRDTTNEANRNLVFSVNTIHFDHKFEGMTAPGGPSS